MRRRDFRFWLSRVVPVKFQSVYWIYGDPDRRRLRATWWQWRGRVWGQNVSTFV